MSPTPCHSAGDTIRCTVRVTQQEASPVRGWSMISMIAWWVIGVRRARAVRRASAVEQASRVPQDGRRQPLPVSTAPRRRPLHETTKQRHRPTVLRLRPSKQRQGILNDQQLVYRYWADWVSWGSFWRRSLHPISWQCSEKYWGGKGASYNASWNLS